MRAAVVSSFDRVPAFGEFEEPVVGQGEVVVEVRAAALSRLVQGQAAGAHYSSAMRLPFVPGVNGVGGGSRMGRGFTLRSRGPRLGRWRSGRWSSGRSVWRCRREWRA